MVFSAPPGVFDLIPKDMKDVWKSTYIWSWLEEAFRSLAKDFCFEEIRTPIFEKTELFLRGVGETSDIVTKEMYTFEDKGDRSLTLRPEGTAPVIRAYLENQLNQSASIHRLFYMGPMFRYERAQAGRYRQHHQFGAEIIGSKAPEIDAELIDMLVTFYSRLKLQDLSVMINCIGNQASRDTYRTVLRDYLQKHFNDLSKDSQSRFEKNPLRILDSKDSKDQEIITQAPKILDFLDQEANDHFEKVKLYLHTLKVPYRVNPLLVRGLDYYTGTVFEVVSNSLGAQNSLGGGAAMMD